MRAIIYCRVSTKDQVRDLSLPTQRKACIEYCQRSYTVDRIFVEEGESAKTANRTELKNLLAYCRQHRGRLHAVIVYALSRFAREKYDHHVLRAALADLQITLRSVTEPIDDSSTGKLMEGIIASIAQFDNDVRSERTVAGMKARLEKGEWTFPPPLGYMKGRDSKQAKTIVPDPKRAPLVTRAFELYATGLHSKQQVLDAVASLGLTAKSGRRISPQTFDQLLRKPIYAGVLEVPGWGIRQPSNAPALVGQKIFDRVQALLNGRRTTVAPRMRNHLDFPLRHFARCGRCDRPLTASWSKGRTERYAYYRCQNRSCKAVNVRREVLERLFVDFLTQLQPKPEYLRLFGEIIIDVWKQKKALAAALHEAAQRHLNTQRERKQRLVEAFVYQRAIDESTYQEQLNKLNEAIALAEINERDTRIEETDVQAAVRFGEFILLSAPRLWVQLSLKQKQRLQQVIFPLEDGVYRTAQTSMVFYELEAGQSRKSKFGSANGNRTRISALKGPRANRCTIAPNRWE
jgi:site-specific DNA recombinase